MAVMTTSDNDSGFIVVTQSQLSRRAFRPWSIPQRPVRETRRPFFWRHRGLFLIARRAYPFSASYIERSLVAVHAIERHFVETVNHCSKITVTVRTAVLIRMLRVMQHIAHGPSVAVL